MADYSQERQFVIHKHTRGTDIHWDLMIEQGDVLKTWRLDNPPEKLATEKTTAIPIFDHDKKFLTYQGIVNNGTGTVEIADEGTCEIISNKEIYFDGKILSGTIAFESESFRH
jgi:bifunctional non-homologous end joining protein LigD